MSGSLKRRYHSPADDSNEVGASDYASENSAVHLLSRHKIEGASNLQSALLVWFSQVHDFRGMPWRKPYDPSLAGDARGQRAYEVWVSEIMLQQTQVATVIPYYNRWMEKFPTLSSLAASDTETINGLWKGLGYYSRGARLLSGAKKVVERFEGRLPEDPKVLEKEVPGIGRYSAGAICSIAYGVAVPVLDGNVHRLMSRLLALHAPPKSKATLDVLWAGASDMVNGTEDPGALNQALIELGSTVCKVRDPLCGECPLKDWCQAYKLSCDDCSTKILDIEEICTLCHPYSSEDRTVTRYPMKADKKKPREETDLVSVVEWKNDDESYFLLVKRPAEGLLAGLWEFPTLDDISPDTTFSRDDVSRLLSQWILHPPRPIIKGKATSKHSELQVKSIELGTDIKHAFSHIKKTFRVVWVLLEGGDILPPLTPSNGRPTKKRRVEVSDDEDEMSAYNSRKSTSKLKNASIVSKWVRESEVDSANVGTGTVKVWKEAKKIRKKFK